MSISGVDVRLILRLSLGPYMLDQDKMVEVSRQPQNLLMIMHLRYVKFVFSEKATKIDQIFTVDLTLTT